MIKLKNLIKGTLLSLVLASVFLVGAPVKAQTDTVTTDNTVRIQELRQRISELLLRIEELRALIDARPKHDFRASGRLDGVRDRFDDKEAFKRMFRKGHRGRDVRLLQKILATDPDIYPEALETGYFGTLTERALKRFQRRAALRESGELDDSTRQKIREILANGAPGMGRGLMMDGMMGDDGRMIMIPSGFLRSPGVSRLLNRQNSSADDLDDDDMNEEYIDSDSDTDDDNDKDEDVDGDSGDSDTDGDS